jgi:hypothetical protein
MGDEISASMLVRPQKHKIEEFGRGFHAGIDCAVRLLMEHHKAFAKDNGADPHSCDSLFVMVAEELRALLPKDRR